MIENGIEHMQSLMGRPSLNILFIVEHNADRRHPGTIAVLQAARQLQHHMPGAKIIALVMGTDTNHIAGELSTLPGINQVIQANHMALTHGLAEPTAAMIVTVCQAIGCRAILAAATTFGKNTLPRVAASLDVAQLSDIIQIINDNTVVRPIYAGNALTTVRSFDPTLVMTVRTTHFNLLPINETKDTQQSTPAPIDQWPADKLPDFAALPGSSFIERQETKSERPDLAAADIVIAGGRGLQSAKQFSELMTTLADKLGAAIGASRAAVDAGFAPNDAQVGQTGKVVAPKLYIAIGISGAIQHLAGMKDSQVIVAINKDPNAPIFQIANYGLVGDLFDIVPALSKALDRISIER